MHALLTTFVAAALIATLLGACAVDPIVPAAPSPGATKASAIEVCLPQGQRAYIARLVCPDGATPAYRRIGSFGPRTPYESNLSEADAYARFKRATSTRALKPGEVDYHTVDQYELTCTQSQHLIYMDMYHCEQPPPAVAPAGFTLRPPPAKSAAPAR